MDKRNLQLGMSTDLNAFHTLSRKIVVELFDRRRAAIVMFLFVLFCPLAPPAFAEAKFPLDFVFGVANAPAQVEDGLDDIWLDWAKLGHVRSWTNAANPNERIQFWNHPEAEVNLAHTLGVNAFRMGLDWGRIMPNRNTIDVGAIRRYRSTIRSIKAQNMKVMLTLWHHDVPKWVQDSGGWHNPENQRSFIVFAERMIDELHDDVEWFITFNEANVFVMMAYTTGAWPPGEKHSILALSPILGGSSISALDKMAAAHNEIYDYAHGKYPTSKLGLAHNMAQYRGRSLIDSVKASMANGIMNWHLPSKVKGHLDFFGMNYYGAEWFKGDSLAIDPREEYSDAGRAIDVNGLYDMLKDVHAKFPKLPILLTENGMADSADNLRPSYIVEHLLAIHKAIEDGIPVTGYFVWTLTDNLEWSDGYCPRFGLASIDRQTFLRSPRTSFYAYSEIIHSHTISDSLRAAAWARVLLSRAEPHFMCRAEDGSSALDVPRAAKYSLKDWRFKSP